MAQETSCPTLQSNDGPKTYYAVKSSNPLRSSRVFYSCEASKLYITGQTGISARKFASLNDARNFITGFVPPSVDYKLIGMDKADFERKYRVTTDNFFTRRCNVYCDGSSLGNGTASARTGYGVYFENEPENNISERLKVGAQTNNRGEIEAISSALDKIWNNLTGRKDKTNYKIKTDSETVAKWLNDIYGSYSVEHLLILANADLAVPMVKKYARVKKYYEINKDHFSNNGDFTVKWVRGHSGNNGNRMADRLAKRGAAKP